MGTDIFGALFASVSGLDAQSTNLSIISNNIANVNTSGYKAAQVEFQTLVSGAGSPTNYASGGVTANNRQLVDGQGLLQSTGSTTDLAIQGNGLFVVNSASNSGGSVLYTRAGSFTQDSSGNFVNAAGYYLQAWKLDSDGRLPGAPGNTTNPTSSANLSSLETVNVENVAGKASATTNVALSINLNAGQATFPGAGANIAMDVNDPTNFGISGNETILPTGIDHLTQLDQIKVATQLNPTGYTYTYGGVTFSRSVSNSSTNGSDTKPLTDYAISSLSATSLGFGSGSNLVTINHAPPTGLQIGDIIGLSGTDNNSLVNGLQAGDLTGNFYVTAVTAGTSFQIQLPTTVTAPTTTAAGNNPFTVTSGSTSVFVNGTPPTHLVNGDTVTISGATSITDGSQTMVSNINGTYVVSGVSSTGYVITLGTAAGGGTAGTGSLTFVSNPSAGDTINLNGVTWTFVTGSATGNETNIGGSLSATLNQLQTDLAASSNANLHNPTATYGVTPTSPNSTTLTISYNTGTTSSNSYTIGAPAVATQHLSGANGTSTAATGTLTMTTNPNPNDTININGVTWTFVTSGSSNTNHETDIGINLSATMTALASDLNTANAGSNASLDVATYASTGTGISITYGTDSLAGNSFTFSNVPPDRSASTLTGGATTTSDGTGTDSGGASVEQFVSIAGTSGATVTSRPFFTGKILDANSASDEFITDTAPFTNAALSFTITVGSTPYTFKYSPSPSATNEFSDLDNLATVISNAGGAGQGILAARVVNDQLYISAVDGNAAIAFSNGESTGTTTNNTLAGGIDWVSELGLAGVGSASNRFSTLQGLTNLVNSSAGLTATISNATSTASVKINVDNPLDKIKFTDGTNTGSVVAALGLVSSLDGASYTQQTTGFIGPAYLATDSATNMAGGGVTPQFSREITVFDSLGTPHNLNIAFINTGPNTWATEVYVPPVTVNGTKVSQVSSASLDGSSGSGSTGLVAYGNLVFNGDGSLDSVSSLLSNAIPIDWSDGASASSITLNWGTAGAIGVGQTNGMSQFEDATNPYTVHFVNPNGTPVGDLTSISIGSTGLVTASFSNGQTQNLYQIPLAIFSNPDRLLSQSGNVYSQTADSGQVSLDQAGSSSTGTISSSSLEQSNVELADQLTTMIVAQQAYEANTKVISTVDTLLTSLDQIFQ